MKINIYIEVFIFLGVIAVYSPLIILKGATRLRGKELSQEYPQYNWMRWGFPTLYFSWIVIVLLFFIKVLSLSWKLNLLFAAGLFPFIGFFWGAFTVITGVSVVPTSAPVIIFIVGDTTKKAGWFQVLMSACLVLVFGVLLKLFG